MATRDGGGGQASCRSNDAFTLGFTFGLTFGVGSTVRFAEELLDVRFHVQWLSRGVAQGLLDQEDSIRCGMSIHVTLRKVSDDGKQNGQHNARASSACRD